MATEKLTKQKIDKAGPQAARYFIWDTEVKGLGLRVAPSGRKTFQLFYRTQDGTQRSPVVGTYGAITLDQARTIARDMLGSARAGGDPSATRQHARESPTVDDACDKFLEEHAARKKPLTRGQYTQIVEKRIKPALGSKKVASVTRDDVARLIQTIGKEHPFAANRTRAVLSIIFGLCEEKEWRPQGSNPVTYVKKYPERTRHRDMNEDELGTLAKVLDKAEVEPEPEKDRRTAGVEVPDDVSENPRAVAAVRLLIFTGMRKNEVLRLRWSEVDLKRNMLHLGDSKTGQKAIHLNAAAIDILESQVRVPGNEYVFPGRKKGRPLSDVKGPWNRIRTRAGLDGGQAMRVHDLRHNFGSAAAAQELSLPAIGKLLGHKRASTTERYAALADHPARRAAEKVGQALSASMNASR